MRDPLRHGGRRNEDQFTVSGIMKLGIKYNWLLTLILMFLLALGFNFKTPKESFDEIHAEINKNVAYDSATFAELRKADRDQESRFSSHTADMNYIKNLVEGMAVRDCQTNFSKAQEALIPCSRLLQERGLR